MVNEPVTMYLAQNLPIFQPSSSLYSLEFIQKHKNFKPVFLDTGIFFDAVIMLLVPRALAFFEEYTKILNWLWIVYLGE